MPDIVHPILRRISHTPLRDVLRFRFTGRLDWKLRVANSGLPKPAADLICRVVKRTRLWRLEKAAVADELVAHFADGLEAGSNVEQLIKSFGDERVAAKLIRRAKRRGRPWPWQVWSFSFRVMVVVLAIYSVLLIRFCVGKPNLSVDYLAKLNQPIVDIPQDDRAWPLWRQAYLACTDRAKDGSRAFSHEILASTQQYPPWPGRVRWLDDHASAIEIARQAGRRHALGFVLGPAGSMDDPGMNYHFSGQDPHEPLVYTLLPHLNSLRELANILSLDVRLAAERGDSARAEADLMAMFGLGRQLRNSDGFVISQLVGLGIDSLTVDRLRFILCNYSGLLQDDQLIRFAHEVSGPRVAADLLGLEGERDVFADILQRVYTDDGHGDGHTTLTGMRSTAMQINTTFGGDFFEWQAYAASSTVPFFSVSRAAVMAEYNRLMDQTEANLHQPIRQIDFHTVELQINALKNSPVDRLGYMILHWLTPSLTAAQKSCEFYLGKRDGALVGIALELYHRRHGNYPVALSELTPGLLPEVPADRITGDPVKYKLIDGKPVIYSVGADRIDDGGKPPSVMDPKHRTSEGAVWGIDPKSAPHGDWLLFAPDLPGADNN